MRILIMENDAAVAQGLAALLRAEGYACDVCATLGCAEAALAVESFDAVLLDLGLPDGDGLVGLQRWRADSRTTPVLVLTARDALPQRVVGLDAGADDDLVKPFAPEEWLARLRVALRAGELLTQLLALARADAPGAEPAEPVDLAALVREVVARLQPMVDARGQHVQTRLQPAIVWGHPTLIHLAVRNLVDNALRHTPGGSRVDVRLGCESDGAVVLQVVDDGITTALAAGGSALRRP